MCRSSVLWSHFTGSFSTQNTSNMETALREYPHEDRDMHIQAACLVHNWLRKFALPDCLNNFNFHTVSGITLSI